MGNRIYINVFCHGEDAGKPIISTDSFTDESEARSDAEYKNYSHTIIQEGKKLSIENFRADVDESNTRPDYIEHSTRFVSNGRVW